MRKLRIAILHIFLIFLVFVSIQCQDPSGAGMGAMGACSPMGMNQATSIEGETTDGSAGYEGPVAIPVTIAKEIDGVDATTVYFEVSGRSSVSSSRAGIGMLYGQLIDQALGDVGIVANNAFVATVSVASDTRYFSWPITDDYVGTSIALVVFAPISTADNGGDVSAPVVVEVCAAEPENELPDPYIQVYVTDLSTASGDATLALDIANLNMVFIDPAPSVLANASRSREASTEQFVFTATDANGEYSLYILPPGGGSPILLAGPLAYEPHTSYATSDDMIYLFDDLGSVYTVDNDGTEGALDLPSLASTYLDGASAETLEYQSICFHPSGNSFAYRTVATVSDGAEAGEETVTYIIHDLTTGTDVTEALHTKKQEVRYLAASCSLFQNTMVITAQNSDGSYVAFSIDSPELSTSGEVTTTTILESDYFIGGHVVGDVQANTIYFRREFANGTIGLSKYNSETVTDIISAGRDVHPYLGLSADGQSYLLFQRSTSGASTICAYFPTTEDIHCFFKGAHPQVSPTDSSIFVYQNAMLSDSGERIGDQVAVRKVRDNIVDAQPLSFENDAPTVPTGQTYTFIANGGLAPYTFSLVLGEGSIEADTGRYTAPTQISGSSAETATVRVTDINLDTLDATVTIPLPGSFDAEFGIARISSIDGSAKDVLQLSDGGLILVGKTSDSKSVIAKITSDGIPDTSFGVDGVTVIEPPAGSVSGATSVGVMSDGSLVVAGYQQTVGSFKQMAVWKLSADGVIDDSFGTNGKLIFDFGLSKDCEIYDIKLLTSNRIVVAGYMKQGVSSNLAVARLNPEGILDSSFGGGTGLMKIDVNQAGVNDVAYKLYNQDNDGRIVLAGYTTVAGKKATVLTRILRDGTALDTTFGTGGSALPNISAGDNYATDITTSSIGTYVVSSYAVISGKEELVVSEFLYTSGLPYQYFGRQGIANIASYNGKALRAMTVAADDDGRIIVAGSVGTLPNVDWFVTRLDDAGELDTAFGSAGFLTYTENTPFEQINEMVLTSEGVIYVVGSLENDSALAVGKIWP